jgi:hypothetical protein
LAKALVVHSFETIDRCMGTIMLGVGRDQCIPRESVGMPELFEHLMRHCQRAASGVHTDEATGKVEASVEQSMDPQDVLMELGTPAKILLFRTLLE